MLVMTDAVPKLDLYGHQGQVAARVLGRLAAPESCAARAPVHPARGASRDHLRMIPALHPAVEAVRCKGQLM